MKDYNIQFLSTLVTYAGSLTANKREIARLEQEIKDRQETIAILQASINDDEKRIDDHIAAVPVIPDLPPVVPNVTPDSPGKP